MSIATIPAHGAGSALALDQASVRIIESRLRDTRQSAIRHRLAAGAFWLGSALATSLAGMALLDYFAELSIAWRAVWFVAVIATVGFLAIRGWRRTIANYTLSRAAAEAEEHISQFGQRLRTTLDYEHAESKPAKASQSLLAAMQNDACRIASQTNWESVVNVRPTFAAFAAAAFVVLVWGVGLVGSEEFRIASARALLLPLEYTNVTYSPHATTIKIGEGVDITADVVGRPIESAQLRYREVGSDAGWTVVDLVAPDAEDSGEESSEATDQPRKLLGSLSARLDHLQHDIEFEVVAGPRPLPAGSITVLQPVTLEETSAHIIPPSYTGKSEETVEVLDLKVLEGSTVELALELNRPVAEALLTRMASDMDEKLQAEANPVPPVTIDGKTLRATLADLRKPVKFNLSAKAADGMELDSQRISIRVQIDRKPEVRFVQPPEELVVTPTTEVPMIVEASDDIGLHKVGIMYQVSAEEPRTLWEQDAEGSAEPFTLSKVLELEVLEVTYKNAITYYAYAEDNYFGETRRTTTPLRYIDIRPFKMAFQVVEGEGGSCNGCSVTLEELIVRQRQNLSQSFAVRDQSPVDQETVERLGAAQAELLEKTREFSDGIQQMAGPILTLSAAVDAMEQAVKSFAKPDLNKAVADEQDALADLIAARENLRKILKQSNSQSSSQCRKFDREQRQKLRMPEKKKQDQQQQLADARKKLDDLAKRERQWSQSCQQCSSSSSQSQSQSKSQSQSQSQSQSASQSKPGESSQQKQESAQQNPQDGSQQKPGEQDQRQNNSPESNSKAPTPTEIAEAQKKLQAELAEMREQLAKLKTGGQAAAEQARQAAESMEQSQAELKKSDLESAAKEGERSADQLEQLSEHLAAMNSRDFGQRLDQARQLAQQLARREETIEKQLGSSATKPKSSSGSEKGDKPGDSDEGQAGNSDPGDSKSQNGQNGSKPNSSGAGSAPQKLARDQRALAGDTDLLNEQLQALARDSSMEKGNVKARLSQLQQENSPHDIAGLMRQAATDLDARRPAQAARGASQARERLDELSRGLGDARADYAQPQLEELVALEEQVAKLREQMKRADEKNGQGKNGGEKKGASGEAQRQWEAIEPRLANLAAGDKKLAEALRELREGKSDQSQQIKPGDKTSPAKPGDELKPGGIVENNGREMPEGHYSWLELGDSKGLLGISKVLQTRIQEAILAGALQDSDQPIPPEYRDLVEKYYRALSDDLR
jgi:hypothetical protein